MTDHPPNGPSRPPSEPTPGGPPWQGPPPGGPPPGGPPVGGPPQWVPPPGGGGPVGWYSGPVPLTGMVPREGIGRAIGRTIAVVVTAMTTVILGFVAMVVALALLIGGLASGTGTPTTGLARSFVAGDAGNANTVLAVPVTGVILGENEGGGGLLSALVGATYGYDVKEELERAAEDRSIKGVVLEMDTPGGTIFGSKVIADAVATYRERTGRPVLAYVRGLSASGGVYAMAGADHIVADHGTLVGSIGVIFGPVTRYKDVVAVDGFLGAGVETTGGIVEEYITAGRSKDLGNPYRDLTDEERRVLQAGVDNNYATFVEHVAAGRSLEPETVRTKLGALVFDEQTALTNGLVDEIGNRDVAYAKAAELAGLSTGNWQVARVDRGGGGLFGLGVLARLAGLVGRPAPAGTPADATARLCSAGPTMLAWFGPLPSSCR
jgi:protease IV